MYNLQSLDSNILKNVYTTFNLVLRQGYSINVVEQTYELASDASDAIRTLLNLVYDNFWYEFNLYILDIIHDELYTNLITYADKYEIATRNINIETVSFGNRTNDIFKFDKLNLSKSYIIDNTLFFDILINEFKFYGEFLTF